MKRILLSFLLAANGCGSTAGQMKPTSNVPKITDDFSEAPALFVNTNPAIHYYTTLSREEGLQQLRQLAAMHQLEEFFVHIDDGQESYWFECGEDETPVSVLPNQHLLQKMPQLFSSPIEVADYHLHPTKTIEGAIGRDNSRLMTDLREYYSSALFSRNSINDVVLHAHTRRIFSSYPRVRLNRSYAVASEGIFSLSITPELEHEILAISDDEGIKKAVEMVYKKMEKALLEGPLAELDIALDLAFRKIEEKVHEEKTGFPVADPSPLQLLQERLKLYQEIGIFMEYHPL